MQSAVPLACFLSLIRPPGVQFENALLQIAPVDKAKCPFVRDHSDIEFRLYTPRNPLEYEVLQTDDDEKLFASSIDFHIPTVIYFHAFMETPDDGSALAIREAYVLRGDTNVIMVDASRLEAGPWYFTAAENTWYIGRFAALLIDWMVSRGLDLKKTHLIGHSLGAQAAGVAGAALNSGRVSRITGLDPALPLFAHLPKEQILDPTDADFVDIIHTDAGIFGVNHPMGHADFYPNGGISPQPGCELEVVIPEQLLLNKCENNPQVHGYYTFYLTPKENQSRRKLERNIYKLFAYLQVANPAMKSDKKGNIHDLNNFKINNPEIKLERDSSYTQDITIDYKNISPHIMQDSVSQSEIKPEQDSIFKHKSQKYNETTLHNTTINNPEINIKEKIITPVQKMKSDYPEVSHDGKQRDDQRNISSEYIQNTTNDTKIHMVEDQLMVESIQKYLAIPIIVKDGVILPYVLQQTLPQETISLDFKKDVNEPRLTENHGKTQSNIKKIRQHVNNEKEDMIMQDTQMQKLPEEIISLEFKSVKQSNLTQSDQVLTYNDQEINDKQEIQTRVDSDGIKQKISQEINREFKDTNQPSTILKIQNIPPILEGNMTQNQENMPQYPQNNISHKTADTSAIAQENRPPEPQNTTPDMQEIVLPNHENMQSKTQQKTTNRIVKRQKRFISLFKRNEAQESDNFLFKMLEFLLKNRKTVIPVFTVMREINTLVKSNNGELNHVSKERNNYIGAPPPVLTPVSYNLELGNENRVMVFIKRLLGLTPKGDRLNISGTGK